MFTTYYILYGSIKPLDNIIFLQQFLLSQSTINFIVADPDTVATTLVKKEAENGKWKNQTALKGRDVVDMGCKAACRRSNLT